jgi:hypothetical protein
MAWSRSEYIVAVTNVAEEVMTGNISHFRPRVLYPYQRGQVVQTPRSELYEAAKLQPWVDKTVAEALKDAVVHPSHATLVQLRDVMKGWMPLLFEQEQITLWE